jgi:hypothetical protein
MKSVYKIWVENLKGRGHLENQGTAEWRIMLIWILRKWNGRIETSGGVL